MATLEQYYPIPDYNIFGKNTAANLSSLCLHHSLARIFLLEDFPASIFLLPPCNGPGKPRCSDGVGFAGTGEGLHGCG